MSIGTFVVIRKDDAGPGKVPQRGKTKPCAERKRGSFRRESRYDSTPTPKLWSKKNDNRKGITRHRQNVVSSQKQRVLREFCLYVVISHSSDMDIQ